MAGTMAGYAIGVLFPSDELRARISTATAYVGLGYIALSLALGPLNLLRSRPNPVSNDLRRDLGIWGALVALVHVGIGLTVHFHGRMHLYFLPPPEWNSVLPVRADAFGGANYLGLVAGIVLLMLLIVSNDASLRRLGPMRWKRWQQFNYVVALTVVAHGVLYQLLERRKIGFVVLFALVVIITVVLQLLGLRVRRLAGARRQRVEEAAVGSSLETDPP